MEVNQIKEIRGVAFIKAEWHGHGEMMPPAKSETLFTINSVQKNRLYTKDGNQLQEMLEN